MIYTTTENLVVYRIASWNLSCISVPIWATVSSKRDRASQQRLKKPLCPTHWLQPKILQCIPHTCSIMLWCDTSVSWIPIAWMAYDGIWEARTQKHIFSREQIHRELWKVFKTLCRWNILMWQDRDKDRENSTPRTSLVVPKCDGYSESSRSW